MQTEVHSTLTTEQREVLLGKLAEDMLCPDELHGLLSADGEGTLTCYDGFEPSGKIHVAQGILKAISINRLLKAGISCIFYVADWFAFLNNKCGADLAKIKTLGRYFVEVWKACGMLGVSSPVVFDSGKQVSVQFVWASEFIRTNSASYWRRVMSISRSFTVPRMQRCSTIMGRSEGDDQPVSQILYPVMQCADVFELKVDLVEMGLDQRKVNVLAREYCEKAADMNKRKPVILMHHMLLGLVGNGKMSKSQPDSAVYMDDSFDEIYRKITSGHCPSEVADNPILEYFRYIIFGALEQDMLCRDQEKCVVIPYGPTVANTAPAQTQRFINYEELEAAYVDGAISVEALKSSLVHYMNDLIAPVRAHFESSPELAQLLAEVRNIRSTR